jgi:putative acetyltransferase
VDATAMTRRKSTKRPPDFTIRPATPDDAEAICAAHVASIRGLCTKDYTPKQIDAWAGSKKPDVYRRMMARGEALFVATTGKAGGARDGEVVGVGGLNADEVCLLYVRPDYARRGVGGALLEVLEQRARENGAAVAKLNSTLTAERFYAARGYSGSAVTMHTLCPGVELPCVPMTKRL